MAPPPTVDLGRRTVAHTVVGAVLVTEGRVLLAHRHPSRAYFPDCWDVPGGHISPGETPQGALRRELLEEVGADVDVGQRGPDFRLVDNGYDLSLWVVRSWHGHVANYAPDEHDALGWFAADELATIELVDPRYLGLLSSVLSGGKARLTWSEDGGTVTKTLVPGLVIPQWASLLGTPRQAALNELRVNRVLMRSPPPVKAPRLLACSRRGPSMTFEAVAGAPLGPKFPGALAETDLDELVALALALLSYKPQRPWFRRLYIERRLALHSRSGLLKQADAEALAHLAAHPAIRWSFAHGDITARNVLRDTKGETALIDWEWAGLYPAGYDLAFLWFSLIGVPGGRAKVEAAVPRHHEVGFLLSATLVQLLHLQLWLHTPHPYMPRHEQTLRELLAVVRSGDGAAQGPALRGPG